MEQEWELHSLTLKAWPLGQPSAVSVITLTSSRKLKSKSFNAMKGRQQGTKERETRMETRKTEPISGEEREKRKKGDKHTVKKRDAKTK